MQLKTRIAAAITFVVAGLLVPVTASEASVNPAGITLPWSVGQSWSVNGPHTDTGAAAGNRNAIDVSGGDGRVLAAAGGTVRLGSCVGGQNFWIDHPGGWRTSYYHVAGIRVSHGQTVGKGDWIANTGTTTPCNGSASGAQLHFSLWKDGQPYPLDGMSLGGWTVRQGSSNYLGSWRRDSDGYTHTVPSTGFMSCGCVNNDGSGSAAISEGQFVSYAGHVYRIAGGAPLYVSSWDRFGGPKPTTALSDAQFNGLRTYPRDGTLISGQAPGHADHGTVYRIAGGAPIYVSSYAHIGGDSGTIGVDLSAIHNAGGGSPWHHLRYRPAEGTLISGWAPGHPEHGSVYTIAGGAPVYVSSFAHIGGDPGTVGVDLAAVHNAGGGGRWSHLNWYPTDGTFVVITDGSVLRFAGGAPIPVSSWDSVGGSGGAPVTRVDHVALSNAGIGGLWNHVRYHPAHGTILDAAGTTYEVREGAPYPFATPTAGTRIDPVAIARAGQPGLWSHLKAPVVAPTGPTTNPTNPAPTPTQTPVPAPTGDAARQLGVRAVKQKSVLRVSVGPPSATADHAFTVQRRTAKGRWKTVARSSTRGSQDVRRVDLRRGVYRVVVPASGTMPALVSPKVRLSR